jgi:large subunit ribosomal protein L29
MAKLDLGEVRNLDDAELANRIVKIQIDRTMLRFKIMQGQVTDVAQKRKLRRDLARLLTIQRQRQLAAN